MTNLSPREKLRQMLNAVEIEIERRREMGDETSESLENQELITEKIKKKKKKIF